jgi:dolichol-phosphate mannosyltransferase
MYDALATGEGNIAIGTRTSSAGGLSPARQKLSGLGAWFFHRVPGAQVNDPMSGFFMIRRDIIEKLAPRLVTDGFKILVDVILSARGELKVVEVPYEFRSRVAGESKLNALVGLDFLGLVVHHATGGVLPIRFVLFALVGAVGLIVHLLVLSIFRYGLGDHDFYRGQFVATLVAMASNFFLNNEITYRRYRFRGTGMIWGFIAFAIVCSLGVLANIDIASALYRSHQTWWLAGLAGAVLSVVWNYAISTNFIWRPRRRR